MNWQNIIAELLYIGIVAEKGRCYGVRWKYGYKKTLRKHIKALNLLQVSLQSDNIEKKKDALNSFINICNKNPKFGKFYNYAFQTLNDLQIEETNLVHHLKTDKLLDTLFHDVLTECSKMIISPKKYTIYYVLYIIYLECILTSVNKDY